MEYIPKNFPMFSERTELFDMCDDGIWHRLRQPIRCRCPNVSGKFPVKRQYVYINHRANS